MGFVNGYIEIITRYNRVVILVLLVATLIVGSAAGDVDSSLSITNFESDSVEAEKLDYIESNFTIEGRNTTVVQVVVRDDNVLSKDSLIETLELQKELLSDKRINQTLRERQPFLGLSNIVAFAAVQQEGQTQAENSDIESGGATQERQPTIDEQIEALETLSEDELEKIVISVLDVNTNPGSTNPLRFLSTSYETGQTTADARVMFVFQEADFSGTEPPEEIVEAQLSIEELAKQETSEETFAFGQGILDEEAKQATGDSFAIITPVAFLLVILILVIAYRDFVDVLLGLIGIILVLTWMGGFMGWTGIGVTQILIAVPFLLIGLSIDFALHVVMRYREERDDSVRDSMKRGLGGVIVAIGAATFTTAVGFLSNFVSPITSIQEFGLVSAFGIVSAFIVFGALMPAVKISVDSVLEKLGFDRRKPAFGVETGIVSRVLGFGANAAKRVPVFVVLLAVLISLGGVYGATQIDTSLSQEEFLPKDSPGWAESLPEPFKPGDYDIRQNTVYINDNFVQERDTSQVQILIEGDVTSDDILTKLDEAENKIGDKETAFVLSNDQPDLESPVRLIKEVSRQNESVASLVSKYDDDGDRIPDENIEELYDAVYAVAPEEASQLLYRSDGEYEALRMKISVKGDASTAKVTEEMRSVASFIEGERTTVTATGQPIINEIVQKGLLKTLVGGFVITLTVILVFLMAIFWYRYRTVSLGVVTIIPVVMALSWILGTMHLLGISFNTETAVITSIAIGLGVDYTIHISERFMEEKEDENNEMDQAISRTIRGTGGALLASASTTAAGFSVLGLALVPSLQRFGIVTGLTILFAFFGSVVVLPSLLVVWEKYMD